MKILHVIRGLANSSGTTHVVIPLAEEQARMGHTVTVFHIEKPGQPSLEPDSSLVESRQFAMTVPSAHFGFSVPFAREMVRRVKEFDVVHIHAVWNFATYWAMRCAMRAGVPYMVAPQGSFEPFALRIGSFTRRIYARWLELPLLKKASRIQALTAAEARQVGEMGIPGPCAIIPNGICISHGHTQTGTRDMRVPGKTLGGDMSLPPRPCGSVAKMIPGAKDRRVEARKGLGIPEEALVVLFLGRLHPKKGVDLLIKAFAALAASFGLAEENAQHSTLNSQCSSEEPGLRNVDLCLLIAGSDGGTGYAEDMRQLANAEGLAGRVRWMGEVRGVEKDRVLAAADLFVLPSHSEGLPVAVLEAMAARLPVVITEACHLPEVAKHGAGLIVEADATALAEGLGRMVADRESREGCAERAVRLVQELFAWPRVTDLALGVYGQISNMTRTPCG